MRTNRLLAAFFVVAAAFALAQTPASTTSPRFFPDDPIAREPESQNVSHAAYNEIVNLYEMSYNLFVQQRTAPSGLRAQNLNTIDEVPDSSWFTNRIGARPLTIDEIARGPATGAPPDPSRWMVIHQKTVGAHPGVTAKDARGETWFLEFDPPYYPEAATGAVVMATKFFWALGYNQVDSYITSFDPARVEFDVEAKVLRPSGKKTPYRRDDLDGLLEHVARRPDGTYRVVAGRLLPGTFLGNFRYEGTRSDDPNDLVPHEHRRELRALRVFGAWTNLTDWKAGNAIDTLITENGRQVVKHWLQDVGSTFGMSNDLHQWDIGWEHYYEARPTLTRLFTFGFALSPWQTVKYVEGPAIGKFEGDRFDPRSWRPQTPTAAYMELRDDDAFWAALRVAAFDDGAIRAIMRTGEFTDPSVERQLADIMIKRRDTIVRTYLPAINPILNPRFDGTRLSFDNAAVTYHVANRPEQYRAAWFRFDNATGERRPIAETTSTTTSLEAPADLSGDEGSFIAVDLAADSIEHPSCKRPIAVYFRRAADGWRLVGLERMPGEVHASGRPAEQRVAAVRQ